MCGIIAFFSTREGIEPTLFNKMRDTLVARGPDGADSRFFRENTVALGHRRLAINDLSESGSQPMCNEDESLWLTFNGEIYNHPQLADELSSLGHVYKSSCDAETVIHAWEEWGEDCLKKFRGIFAFVIWDKRTGSVFCARDHLGVKPLYYYHDKHTLIVASQPRAFLNALGGKSSIDEQAFLNYLYYGVVPDQDCIFKGVKKLPPAHTLTWHGSSLNVGSYWGIQYKPEIRDREEAESELSRVLEESVRLQLLSDVQYGAFLSGGIDSSLITAIAARHSTGSMPTVSVGFPNRNHNELPFAKHVADLYQTDHREAVLGRKGALKLLDNLAEVHDEPYGLGAGLPMMFISEVTKEMGFKVMLAGDGADELFAGYHHYDQVRDTVNAFSCYQPHEAMIHSHEELKMVGHSVELTQYQPPSWRYQRFHGDTGNSVLDAQILDARTYLPDEILMKVDRASMACGIEVRVPFLDQRLVELVFNIDHTLIYHENERKALLKSIARKWLPDSVLTQRKKGFSIPLRRWTVNPFTWSKMYKTILNGVLVDYDFIDGAEFTKKGLLLSPTWMWKLYVAEIWARRWAS